MKRNKGFTLVEMIVVLVILSVVAAMAVPALLGFIDKGKEKECQSNRESILLHYAADVQIAKSKNEVFQLKDEIGERKDSIKCPSGIDYNDLSDYDSSGGTKIAVIKCEIHGISERNLVSGEVALVTKEPGGTSNPPTTEDPIITETTTPSVSPSGTPIPTETDSTIIVPTQKPEETQEPTSGETEEPSVNPVVPDGEINIKCNQDWDDIIDKSFKNYENMSEGLYVSDKKKSKTYIYVFQSFIPQNNGYSSNNQEGNFLVTRENKEEKNIAIVLRNPERFYSDDDWDKCGRNALSGEIYRDKDGKWYVCIKNTEIKPPSKEDWLEMTEIKTEFEIFKNKDE